MTARRPLLLIVDDHAPSAILLGRLLHDDGYDTEISTDGASALARLAHAPVPDAVITDYHLGDGDGFVVVRRARATSAGIPIFIVTGDPESAAKADPPAGAPVVLLAKPIDYASLVRRLQVEIAGRT